MGVFVVYFVFLLFIVCLFFFFFFFFKQKTAYEIGRVTGVQTCALPILLHMVRDETSEEEPDIEDIDSHLEQIDSHEELFEAPELQNSVAASETMSVPGEVATGSETQVEHATDTPGTPQTAPGALATGSESTDTVAI